MYIYINFLYFLFEKSKIVGGTLQFQLFRKLCRKSGGDFENGQK
jgi:hypothetical protein